jgi:rSAM/selenodomain-associated transferase 2
VSRHRLSIIVPALNEADRIAGLLADLDPLRQRRHEVIVVDGGSDDPTAAIAAPRADRVITAERGRARQMNAGARLASGDVLWFLHADSRVPLEAADAVVEACATGCAWGRFDVRLSGRQPLLRIIERLMNLRSRLTGIATGDQGIFVTRATFESVGGFPEIPLMEDIALSKALRRLSAPRCIRRPRLLASSRRWEEHGILPTMILMWRLRLAFARGAAPADLARRYP